MSASGGSWLTAEIVMIYGDSSGVRELLPVLGSKGDE
jgi:hypothetical protein